MCLLTPPFTLLVRCFRLSISSCRYRVSLFEMTGVLRWVAFVGVVHSFFLGDVCVMGALDESQPTRKCWVFNHMNKSGGKTVKYMLRSWVERNPPNVEAVYDSGEWMSGGTFANDHLHSNATLTMGGYTEGLRPFGDQGCKWFTVFRQ